MAAWAMGWEGPVPWPSPGQTIIQHTVTDKVVTTLELVMSAPPIQVAVEEGGLGRGAWLWGMWRLSASVQKMMIINYCFLPTLTPALSASWGPVKPIALAQRKSVLRYSENSIYSQAVLCSVKLTAELRWLQHCWGKRDQDSVPRIGLYRLLCRGSEQTAHRRW